MFLIGPKGKKRRESGEVAGVVGTLGVLLRAESVPWRQTDAGRVPPATDRVAVGLFLVLGGD